MPIERRSPRNQTSTILIAVFSLVLVAGVLYALVQMADGSRGLSIDAGDDRFRAGDAEVLARRAAQAPILLSDVSGNGQKRPIVVTHSGDDPRTGWVAFEARSPGAPQSCILEVDRKSGELRYPAEQQDLCGSATFDGSGEGFVTYSWKVTDGSLIIDLVGSARSTTTSAPTAPPSTAAPATEPS